MGGLVGGLGLVLALALQVHCNGGFERLQAPDLSSAKGTQLLHNLSTRLSYGVLNMRCVVTVCVCVC